MPGATGDFWIVVPVKDTRQSKQRLAGLLDGPQRKRLAHTMLEDVLEAIAPLKEYVPCALVTVDPFAEELASRHGFRVLAQGAHDGHTGAVDGGRNRLKSEGARGFLTLPGDIPDVTTDEISAVLSAHEPGPGFTIVPAADELGSNCIAMSPPDAVPLKFGENSFFPHLDAARAQGYEPQIIKLPGIGRDIDTPEDIERYMSAPPVKTRTRALLTEYGLAIPPARDQVCA